VTGATLDSGALIAFERGAPRMIALVDRALGSGARLAVPAGVLAQTWRGDARQARLSRLVRAPLTEVVPLDELAARAVGVICGQVGATDVVDVSVVVCARERGLPIVSGDPDDLHAIDPSLTVIQP
jgi:hypothetical protein